MSPRLRDCGRGCSVYATSERSAVSGVWHLSERQRWQERRSTQQASVSAISDAVYRYTDEGQHPGVADAFRRSIATVAALPCNMFARIGAEPGAPLVDANACRALASQAGKTLDERLAKERASR